MQFEWFHEYSVYSLIAVHPVQVVLEEATCPLSPLPWTPWDDNVSSSFSPDDERFIVDTFSDLTDTDIAPSSPAPSESLPSPAPSSPLPFLPQTQQEQPIIIIHPPKVKRTWKHRKCQQPGCEKFSRGHGLCGAHGGGKQCELCTKASRKSGLCHRHFRLTQFIF